MAAVTIATLNAIRSAASTEYQTRIPLATRDNITAIGNTLSTYTTLMNEFTTNLIGKIGLTVFSDTSFENKLAPFKKGFLGAGVDVEEIFIEMAAAAAFDKDGTTTLARAKKEVLVKYHRENRQDTYKVTLADSQLKNAFASPSGVTTLLDKFVASVYNGSENDEYILMKELLAEYAANYTDYQIAPITDAATTQTFLRTVRKAVADVGFVSTAFNKAGVKTMTRPQDLVLLVNKDILSHVDVDVLAKSFNLGKTDFEPKIIVLDDFGSMADTYGLLVDKDFFMVYDTLHRVEEQRNAQGMFTNHFLHIWQILSLSEFKNAIRFQKTVA